MRVVDCAQYRLGDGADAARVGGDVEAERLFVLRELAEQTREHFLLECVVRGGDAVGKMPDARALKTYLVKRMEGVRVFRSRADAHGDLLRRKGEYGGLR